MRGSINSAASNPVLPGKDDCWRFVLPLFAESLGESLTVGVEEFLAALLPDLFHFGGSDVPVGTAFLEHRTKVLAELFYRGPPKEPIAVIDLVNDQARLEDNDVRDHRIVQRVGVLGDVEIFMNHATRVGQECPVGADSGAIFACLGEVVGADRDQPALPNF